MYDPEFVAAKKKTVETRKASELEHTKQKWSKRPSQPEQEEVYFTSQPYCSSRRGERAAFPAFRACSPNGFRIMAKIDVNIDDDATVDSPPNHPGSASAAAAAEERPPPAAPDNDEDDDEADADDTDDAKGYGTSGSAWQPRHRAGR